MLRFISKKDYSDNTMEMDLNGVNLKAHLSEKWLVLKVTCFTSLG